MDIRLSKSALETFRRCARCFWLEKVQGIKPPDGIRAGVPMGIDRVLKGHYDAHRAAGTLPPELAGAFPAGTKLYAGDRISMKDLRNWRKGLVAQVGRFALSTALDDLLLLPDGRYAMIDYKSKAKETNVEDTEKYYQLQGDCYDLALNENKYPTNGKAYFAYYFPDSVRGGFGPVEAVHGGAAMQWGVQVIEIPTDHDRAKVLTARAGEALEGATPPRSHPACEQCVYLDNRKAFDRSGVAE